MHLWSHPVGNAAERARVDTDDPDPWIFVDELLCRSGQLVPFELEYDDIDIGGTDEQLDVLVCLADENEIRIV